MGIYISLADKKRTEMKGKIRVVDPSPVWVGTRPETSIKRFMPSDKAEEWMKSDPTHQVRLHLRRYELDQY